MNQTVAQNEFEQLLTKIFNENAGNRLSQELSNGMYTAILQAHENKINKLTGNQNG